MKEARAPLRRWRLEPRPMMENNDVRRELEDRGCVITLLEARRAQPARSALLPPWATRVAGARRMNAEWRDGCTPPTPSDRREPGCGRSGLCAARGVQCRGADSALTSSAPVLLQAVGKTCTRDPEACDEVDQDVRQVICECGRGLPMCVSRRHHVREPCARLCPFSCDDEARQPLRRDSASCGAGKAACPGVAP